MTIEERKALAVARKLESVGRDLEAWRNAALAKDVFRRHRGQIDILARELIALARLVGARLAGNGPGDPPSPQLVERMTLDIHRAWELYSAKLATRALPWMREFLALMDDLAWECWLPVRRNPSTPPPLVFLSSELSPFAAARGEPSGVTAASSPELRAALSILPVALIGLPWHQACHLPDAVLVAHEVGHLVESEHDLGGALAAVVDGAVADKVRRAAWRAWIGECFADAWGCAAAGPEFVSALFELLAERPEDVAGQALRHPGWGRYPTHHLRARLNVALLDALGRDGGAALAKEWLASYPVSHPAMEGFVADLARIARGLAELKLPHVSGGRAVKDVFVHDETAIRVIAHDLGRVRRRPVVARHLAIAARRVFSADARAYGPELDRWIVSLVDPDPGYRAAATPRSAEELYRRLVAAHQEDS